MQVTLPSLKQHQSTIKILGPMRMKLELRLALLGKVELQVDGQPLTALTALKAKALFVYLAVTGTSHSRASLAALLWSDVPEETARANLRSALYTLRKLLGDYLVADRRTVAFDQSAPFWLDTAVFTSACAGETFEDWETAVSLYHDDFLNDFYVPEAPLFEEWVVLEREHHRLLLLATLGQLITVCLETAAYPAGIQYARRLLRLDSLREEGHRQLMQLLAASGKRSQALAHYDLCREILAEELGVSPSVETLTLYEQIKTGNLKEPPVDKIKQAPQIDAASASTPPPPHNLPVPTTAFIGRDSELVQIGELLADSDCRLLTILGPGGIGKTRLALAAARDTVHQQNGRFPDGVWFVRLASVTDADSVATAIMQALKISLLGKKSPHEELLNYLRQKHLLLVLDNFEHLLEQAEFLLEILQTAVGVEFIVTSRERLHLYEEWLLVIEGLPIPPEQATQIEQYDAVRLFTQRARRVNLQFDLAAEETAVAHICRLVEGMPLGIELAAAQVRVLPCQTIAAEIERNLILLATSLRNIPPRQRSLLAAFDYSWQFLNDDEQQLYAQLSVFRDGFTSQAAQEVTHATLRQLAGLVDKSLISRTASGRYQMHTLLQQFAAERLALQPSNLMANTQAKHSQVFAQFMHKRTAALRGIDAETVADEIAVDFDNVRAAWNWAILTCATDMLTQTSGGLYEYCDLRARYKEGQQLIAQAAEKVVACTSVNELLLAQLQTYNGALLSRVGQAQQGTVQLETSIQMLRQHNQPHLLADALNSLANNLRILGDYDQAQSILEECKQICETIGYEQGLAITLAHLGLIMGRQGKRKQAIAYHRQSIVLLRQSGLRKTLASALSNLGMTLLNEVETFPEAEKCLLESVTLAKSLKSSGVLVVALQNLSIIALYKQEWPTAIHYLSQSLALAEELGAEDLTVFILGDLAEVYTRSGEWAQAKNHCQTALQMARRLGIRWAEANSLTQLGNLAVLENQLVEAQQWYQTAVMTAQAISATAIIKEALTGWALVLGRQGETVRGLSMLIFLIDALQDDKDRRESAEKALAELSSQVSPEVLDQAQQQATLWSLETLISQILEPS